MSLLSKCNGCEYSASCGQHRHGSNLCGADTGEINRSSRRWVSIIPPMRLATFTLALAFAMAARAEETPPRLPPPPAPEQEPWSLDLTVHDFGIGIGNSKHVDGLRLNFRDVAPFTVHGINVTLWMPANTADGEVDGLAIGLPVTGAGTLRGLGVGFGLGITREAGGVGLGILGVGSGGALRGIFVGGLGVGSGGDLDGLAAGGLGVGCGGNVRGILFGGLGAGCGGNITGIAAGGLGVGAGGRIRGIVLGGLGAGSGGGIDGIAVGGLGVGAGGDLRGLAIGGLGVGAGGTILGVAVGGLGVGAPRIRGAVAALAAGGQDVQGMVIAPGYFEILPDGQMTGVSVSAFNRIRGEQRGLAIGLVNYAAILHGVQIGLVNWADNNPSGLKILPIANAHFD
jgi:hypothetical protein